MGLDGPESIHDKIRGKDSFQKTVSNLTELVRRKRQGKRWLIGVECTIMSSNISVMRELLTLCEYVGIDWMVFNHLWIIADNARLEYREFCRKFGGTEPLSIAGFDSQFNDAICIEYVVKECCAIKHCKSSIPVFFSPDLSSESLRSYYYGTLPSPPSYLKLGVKLDVEANGDVVAFKLFPDVILGNICHQSVQEILGSSQYQRVAQYLLDQGLAICNSCPDFYNLGGVE